MAKHRLFAAALAAIVVAVPVAAQKGGTVEVGGFGQYTVADDAWHVQNGWGLGGRLGVFLASHWELEAAAAFSTFTNEAPRARRCSPSSTSTSIGRSCARISARSSTKS